MVLPIALQCYLNVSTLPGTDMRLNPLEFTTTNTGIARDGGIADTSNPFLNQFAPANVPNSKEAFLAIMMAHPTEEGNFYPKRAGGLHIFGKSVSDYVPYAYIYDTYCAEGTDTWEVNEDGI